MNPQGLSMNKIFLMPTIFLKCVVLLALKVTFMSELVMPLSRALF